ncbi:Lreu_0056 family protein [Limosilactobacillus caccae]|uniref:Lreu_0056 family protein n=1 Tax=Limosilactobacillus caccae TaxID=1926284 RepID=UPI00097022D2|nr:hypothetical protein [Limosilactobacillus caccae]
MKKLITIAATVLAGCSLAACESSSSDNAASSSSTSQTSSSSQKHVLRSAASKKSSSATTSSTTTVSDPRVIGILAYEEVFGKSAGSEELYFSTNTGDNNNGNDGDYLVSAGSTVGTISFSVNGDQVTIYQMDSAGTSDAEAQYTSSTVSLKELEDKFYSSSADKESVDAAAQNLKDGNNPDDSESTADSDDEADDSDDEGENDETTEDDEDIDDMSVIINQQGGRSASPHLL